MEIKAVIFDFDEVILKSYKDHIKAFLLTGKNFGYRLDKRDVFKKFGKSAKDILKDILPRLKESEIEDFVDEKERIYRRMTLDRPAVPMKGARTILRFLAKKDVKLAISSSASIKNILISLGKMRLRKYFKVIVAAEHVKHHKPHPEPLLKAAKLLKVAPTNCIYIGDSIFEMEAARRAGMEGIAILTGVYNYRELKDAGARHVFSDMNEVRMFFEGAMK